MAIYRYTVPFWYKRKGFYFSLVIPFWYKGSGKKQLAYTKMVQD